MKLYDGMMSWNGRKVRVLAAELGLPLERVVLDFRKGEYKTPEYLAKNPNGKVPMLEDDGFHLWESNAILLYLAGRVPERNMLGRDAHERARVDQWLFWYTAHIDPMLDILLRERRIKAFIGQQGNDPSLIAEAESQLARFLKVLDEQLAKNEWVVGPLTVVDFAMGAQLDMAGLVEVDTKTYENITTWLKRLQSKPYWATA
jgi:glutathione S-transferase